MKPNSAAFSTAAFDGTDGDHPPRPVVDPLPRRSLAVGIALALLRLYQLTFSPLLATGACRFLPTCSDYATEAIATHGVARGTWLAFKRLVRCHPLCDGGHDPVPPRT